LSVSYRLISASELDPALIEAWRSIQSGSTVFESPYFCPEFTQLVGGVRDDVRVVVIENGARPVGFFPHQRAAWGMGKPVGGPLSDYHGVVAAPGSEWELDALMRAAKLSVWAFDHLVGVDGKFEPHVTARAASPQIDFSAGYEQYARGRRDAGSDYIRKTEGLARKLSREVGELRFTLHEPESGVMEQLIRWKRNQYRRAKTNDVFSASWTGQLLRKIALTQTAGFAGVCSVLRVGDRMIAAHMGMRSRDSLHYWFPAYDPEFAQFSPGIILLLRMAQAMAGSAVRKIDLGKGDSQYKRRLMTGAAELLEGFVEMPSLLASARRLQRAVEARALRGGMAAALRLPLRVIRRIERTRTFR
jgi:CelD/BcsL family acetyltransferase involved in cellulose biosynthesis